MPSVTPHQPVLNVILSVLSYVPSAAVVPLVLLLLVRTGQRPADLGLTRLPWRDLGVAVGLAAAAIGLELSLAIVISPLGHSRFMNRAATLNVPAYYLLIALSVALTTAVAEEVIVNGYLLTRLDQLGWSPAKAFWLSMALRASYHLYYGIGVVLTLPFGWLVTRSFQKHRKLNRPIVAHFLYDGTVATIAIWWPAAVNRSAGPRPSSSGPAGSLAGLAGSAASWRRRQAMPDSASSTTRFARKAVTSA